MIERAGGARCQHLHPGDVTRHLHGLRIELRREGKQEFADPVLEQISVTESLEERVPVMLVHIDEAGQHDCTGGIDDLIEAAGRGRALAGADGGDLGAVDGDKAAGEHRASRIDGHDVAILDERSRHRSLPVRGRRSFDLIYLRFVPDSKRHPARYAVRTCGLSINSRPLPSSASAPDSRRYAWS